MCASIAGQGYYDRALGNGWDPSRATISTVSARVLLRGPQEVGRVIARPFEGEPGRFVRTPNRRDFAVPPPQGMLLDKLSEQDVPVYSVGKIADIFLKRGIRQSIKTKNNDDG